MLELRDGELGRLTRNSITHMNCTNQTTSWLVHNWSTFGARTSHGQTQIHKIHHGPDLGEAITFPLIVYSVLGHKTSTQMSFCFGTPEIPKIQTLAILESYNFLYRPSIEVRSEVKL
jgi:hypothetical protein